MAAKLRSGDTVVVIAGRDKGKSGEIQRILRKEERAVVAGVNMIVRHQRDTAERPGGRIRREAPIHISNLALADPKDSRPTRVGFRLEGEEGEDPVRVRFAKRSGEKLGG